MTDPLRRPNPTMRRFRYFDDRDEGLAGDWLNSLTGGAAGVAGAAADPFLRQMASPPIQAGPLVQAGLEALAGPPSHLAQAHQPIGLGSPPQPRFNLPDFGVVGDLASDVLGGAASAADTLVNEPLRQAWGHLTSGFRGLGGALEAATPQSQGPRISASPLGTPQPQPQPPSAAPQTPSPYMLEGPPKPRANFSNVTNALPAPPAPPQPRISAPSSPQRAMSPQELFGPRGVATPFEPSQSPLLGEVAEPPMANHAAAASMMGAFPPGGMQSPLAGERPVEDYFSDASLQARLADAQRNARAMSLLAFGAGMLGGDDLMSGLSAGIAGTQAPLDRLQQQREELPLQYADARFRYGLDRSSERRADAADRRAEAAEGRAVEEQPYRIGTLEHQQKVQGYEGSQIDSGFLERMDILKERLTQAGLTKEQQEIEYWGDRIKRERDMAPHEINAIKARIAEIESQTGVNRANQAAIESGQRYGGSDGPRGMMTEGGAFNNMQEEFKAYEASDDYDPSFSREQHMARVLRRVLWKVGGLSSETLERMNPDLADAVEIQNAINNGTINELLQDPQIGPQIRGNRTLMELINLLTNPIAANPQ